MTEPSAHAPSDGHCNPSSPSSGCLSSKRTIADEESGVSPSSVASAVESEPLGETKDAANPSKRPKSRPSQDWSYVNKKIMAPMVRIGTLPMRLLAQRFGADICYSEEIIDRKITQCKREVDEKQGVISYMARDNRAVFQTVPDEPVVFQMGTADSVNAVKAALTVCGDVRAIDVNMGCPKHFSISGGMGSALLKQPETVKDILTSLVRNVHIPVTCKIRLLRDPKDTITLCKIIEQTGVAALAVHARYVEDRPRHKPMAEQLPIITSSLSIPVIFNGDAFLYEDFARLAQLTGAQSVMSARGVMWNPSIFRAEGPLPLYSVAADYLALARAYNNNWQNTKYCLQEMVKEHCGATPAYMKLVRTKGYHAVDEAMAELSKLQVLTRPYVPPTIRYEDRPDPAQAAPEACTKDSDMNG